MVISERLSDVEYFLRPAEIKRRVSKDELRFNIRRDPTGYWIAFAAVSGSEHVGRFVVCGVRGSRKARTWRELGDCVNYIARQFDVVSVHVNIN